MTKKYIFGIVVISFSVWIASCQRTPSQSSDGVLRIDLEPHMKAIDTLRVSDYFASVEYIPLETHDSCFVGDMPRLIVHKDSIVLTSEHPSQCLTFDKSGRFLRHIGSVGKGPGEYKHTADIEFNEYTGTLNFYTYNDERRVSYAMNGNYLGDYILPCMEGWGHNGWLNDGTRLRFYEEVIRGSKWRMRSFDQTGNVVRTEYRKAHTDSFRAYIENTNVEYAEMSNRALNMYGIVAMQRVFIRYTSTQLSAWFVHDQFFSHHRDQTFLRERHNDTIFEVTREGLIPHLILDLGKYHWPREHKYEDIAYSSDHTYITWYGENDRFVFFQFFMGGRGKGKYANMEGNITPYTGVYDKTSGRVKIAKANDGFIDDVHGFMPLRFLVKTLEGDCAGLLYPWDIRQWFEENPDKAAKLPEHLKRLRNISEEANPVVVVMRQKK